MYVGVIHSPFGVIFPEVSIPHVCGGDPKVGINIASYPQYSPCMWG